MTREEILNMKAGREMDALIATQFTKFEHYQGEWWWQDGNLEELPDYSTDICEAWNVIMKFAKKFIEVYIESRGTGFFVMIGDDLEDGVSEDSCPLAICKAALLAKIAGVEV